MRILSLIFCGLSLAATAQEKATRTCRIIFLQAPENAPQSLQLFDGTTSQEVELPRMNFSPVYQIEPGAISLRLLPAPPAKPEEINPAAPGAKVAADVTDCYLLVASDPTNPVTPVRMSVINAGQGIFKNGQMLWFNLSDKTVGGQIGKQRLSIEPSARSVIDAPASKSEDYNVNLAFYITGNEKLQPLCETKWHHDPGSRTVLFLINEPGSRTPRVLGFPDRREPKAQAMTVPTE
jgi:hypothetical protein